jgi:sortase A
VLSRFWGLLLLLLLCTACAGSAFVPAKLERVKPNMDKIAPTVRIGSEVNSRGLTSADPTESTFRFASAAIALPAPTRIRIPALQVDTAVVPVGLEPDGAMAMPSGFDTVGWYNQGSIPGSPGRATLSGHLDSKSGPAIFFTLHKLRPNDMVHVELGHGMMVATFRITQTITYAADQVPINQIFGPSKHAQLVLITCAGTFDRKAASYTERLVVYAELVELK